MPATRSKSRSPRRTPISNQNRPARLASLSTSYLESADWGSDLTSVDDSGTESPTRQPLQNITQVSPRRVQPKRKLSKKGSAGGRTICVKGVELQATVILETFWYFASERNAIDERRRAGQAWPWTDDKILREYYFCNSYRVLDKTSQYIVREVVEKGPQEPEEITFRVVLFNLFTKIETWEVLTQELGKPHLTWKDFKFEDYAKILRRIKNEGGTVYTGAFQKPYPRFARDQPSYINHLHLLEALMEGELAWRLLNAKYVNEVYEWLISFPSMGEFNTYQLILNLLYSPVLNFSGNDFVIAGLGAVSGLQKMFGAPGMRYAKDHIPNAEVEIIRWLQENQDAEFKRLGLPFNGLGPDHLPLDLADIEHLLCEVDKFSRKRHSSIKGNDRTEIRQKYTPHSRPYPKHPAIPKAWSHPNRKLQRVWANPPIVEKRYLIRKIAGHRIYEGKRQYFIQWEGYAAKYDTWEWESSLLEDAPLIVKEYKKKQRLK